MSDIPAKWTVGGDVMERRLSESVIVRELAESVCRRVARRAIRALQGMTGHLLSGDGSGLRNAWDEICVQVQFEESVYWDAYEQTVEATVAGFVDELPDFECDAVWLQTRAADDWDGKDEGRRDPYPVIRSDVVAHIVEQYLYYEADRWSNPQIKQYLDRSC